MNSDEKYMQRCLDLAIKGAGYVAPNPLVGSVIVQDGKIIGEGYHQCYGEAHAEVNAVASVQNKSLLKNSTIYVNLEPCAHFGKTPPCADLIVEAGIPTVVIGTIDPFASVAGKGIEKLKKAGIQVKVNILKEACLELNKRFFTFHQKKRPYIILKWAQSRDGFMDMNRQNNEKGTFWITAPATKTLVHKWRHEEAGILVGKNTIKTDDPALTCRVYQGQSPIRLIIDQKMRLDYSAFKVGDRSVQTYILTEKEVQSAGKLQFIQPTQFDLGGILDTLYRLDIQSILVEGGPTTLGRFIEENCWDEARILTGETTLNEGLAAPSLPLQKTLHKAFKFGVDTVQIYRHD